MSGYMREFREVRLVYDTARNLPPHMRTSEKLARQPCSWRSCYFQQAAHWHWHCTATGHRTRPVVAFLRRRWCDAWQNRSNVSQATWQPDRRIPPYVMRHSPLLPKRHERPYAACCRVCSAQHCPSRRCFPFCVGDEVDDKICGCEAHSDPRCPGIAIATND